EEATRQLERDERVWAREYGAIPQGGVLGAIDPEALRGCIRNLHGVYELDGPEVVLDTSGARHDRFVIAVCGWLLEDCGESEVMMHDAIDPRTGAVVFRNAGVVRDREGNTVPNPKWSPPAQRLYLQS